MSDDPTKDMADSTGELPEADGERPEEKPEDEKKEPTGIDEEGNLDVAVGVNQQGEVCIQFGVTLKRVCLGPEEAVQLANAIGLNANKAARYLAALKAQKAGGLVGPDGKPVGGN